MFEERRSLPLTRLPVRFSHGRTACKTRRTHTLRPYCDQAAGSSREPCDRRYAPVAEGVCCDADLDIARIRVAAASLTPGEARQIGLVSISL